MATYDEAFPRGANAPKDTVRAWAAGIDAKVGTIPTTTAGLPPAGDRQYVTAAQLALLAGGALATSYVATTLAGLNAYTGVPTGALGRVTSDGANTGLYMRSAAPAWVYFSADIETLYGARIDAVEQYTTDFFRAFADDLADPFTSLLVAFEGDSLTSGVGATGITTPKNLISGNYPDQFLRRLASVFAPGVAPTLWEESTYNYSGGYQLDRWVNPADPAIVLKNSANVVISRAATDNVNSPTGSLLTLAPGDYIEFPFFGEAVYCYFPKQTYADTGNIVQLKVDGVIRSAKSPYAATSSYPASPYTDFTYCVSSLEPTWGAHVARITNLSATSNISICGPRLLPRRGIQNAGYSGKWSGQGLPAGSIPITRIKPHAKYLFINLGTNDRVRSTVGSTTGPDNAYRLYSNLDTTLAYLKANYTTTRVCLISPNYAQGSSEYYSNPTSYCFSQREVASTLRRLATKHGVALVDMTSITAREIGVRGASLLSDSTLHPNDAGYVVYADELFDRVCRYRR